MPTIDNAVNADVPVDLIDDSLAYTGADDVHPGFYYPNFQAEALGVYRSNIENGRYRFEYSACAFCGSVKYTAVSEKDRYGNFGPVAVCRQCGLVQSQPMPTEDTLTDFYANLYTRMYRGVVDGHKGRLSKPTKTALKFAARTERLKIFSSLPAGAKVVEVGCGNGHIVSHLSKIHKHLSFTGFDFDKIYMEHGVKIGLDMRFGRFRDYPDMVDIEVFYYNQVFEHIRDLQSEVFHLKKSIKRGGKLILAVPGLLGGFGSQNVAFLEYLQNAHVYYFDLNSLTRFFAAHGFSLISGDEGIFAVFEYLGDTAPAIHDSATTFPREVEHDRKIFYLKTYNAIYRSRLRQNERVTAVAGHLVRHAHPHTGLVNLTRRTLADMTGLTNADLTSALGQLREPLGLKEFRSNGDALFVLASAHLPSPDTVIVREALKAMEPYSDLAPRAEIVDVANKVGKSLALRASAERFLAGKQFRSALIVSALALHRTPASTSHLAICAACLTKLGAPERASPLLARIEELNRSAPSAPVRVSASGAARPGRVASLGGLLRRALKR